MRDVSDGEAARYPAAISVCIRSLPRVSGETALFLTKALSLFAYSLYETCHVAPLPAAIVILSNDRAESKIRAAFHEAPKFDRFGDFT